MPSQLTELEPFDESMQRVGSISSCFARSILFLLILRVLQALNELTAATGESTVEARESSR
jgi:hypothetical protein